MPVRHEPVRGEESADDVHESVFATRTLDQKKADKRSDGWNASSPRGRVVIGNQNVHVRILTDRFQVGAGQSRRPKDSEELAETGPAKGETT